MERIVVGVDGSEGARSALRWAIAEGRLRGGLVEAVHAWQPPSVGYPHTTAAFDPSLGERSAEAMLDAVVDAEDAEGLPAPVGKVLVCGTAPSVLLGAVKGADLLVVGSRGRGGFAGLLLGSVSQQCSQHAPGPVVIVPAEE